MDGCLVSVKMQNELLHVYEYLLSFQIKYSLMKPGVHVWPHCGPTNCRIRAHLGLVIPDGPKIRVADETRYRLIFSLARDLMMKRRFV